jgi:hypothetical protein
MDTIALTKGTGQSEHPPRLKRRPGGRRGILSVLVLVTRRTGVARRTKVSSRGLVTVIKTLQAYELGSQKVRNCRGDCRGRLCGASAWIGLGSSIVTGPGQPDTERDLAACKREPGKQPRYAWSWAHHPG